MKHRSDAALQISKSGGALALNYFRELGSLEIVDKGLQDFVTVADQNVELHVRNLIEEAFPNDGIVGEEHAPKIGTSGYQWIIDPIDGTSNFINAMPAWTVVIAVVQDDATQIGVIHDPVHDETFHAIKGEGATLNGEALQTPTNATFNRGSVSTGYCNRVSKTAQIKVIEAILERDGVFHRNGSGALSLAYVAAGRLIGYIEEHMNAWDCIAGQLIIAEAGGCVEDQPVQDMIANGGRVVAG
ncbi:MAG: inositol monophosphatase family protein, partial [Planktomarina sp.]